jgi:hypothetical protein
MAGNPHARVGSAVTPVISGTLRAQIDATLNRLLGEECDDGSGRADSCLTPAHRLQLQVSTAGLQ